MYKFIKSLNIKKKKFFFQKSEARPPKPPRLSINIRGGNKTGNTGNTGKNFHLPVKILKFTGKKLKLPVDFLKVTGKN